MRADLPRGAWLPAEQSRVPLRWLAPGRAVLRRCGQGQDRANLWLLLELQLADRELSSTTPRMVSGVAWRAVHGGAAGCPYRRQAGAAPARPAPNAVEDVTKEPAAPSLSTWRRQRRGGSILLGALVVSGPPIRREPWRAWRRPVARQSNHALSQQVEPESSAGPPARRHPSGIAVGPSALRVAAMDGPGHRGLVGGLMVARERFD